MNNLTEEKVIQHFLDRVNEEATNKSVSQLELFQQLLNKWAKEHQREI